MERTCRTSLQGVEGIMHAEIIDVGRGPQIAGTRLTVYDIMDYLRMDWHHTAIAAELRISSYQVLAAMKYIEEHRAEVEAEYKIMLERDAQGNPPEIQAKLEASHAKLQALLDKRRQELSRETKDARNPGGPQ
jgi:uncharacterized protein (DUF433 family)